MLLVRSRQMRIPALRRHSSSAALHPRHDPAEMAASAPAAAVSSAIDASSLVVACGVVHSGSDSACTDARTEHALAHLGHAFGCKKRQLISVIEELPSLDECTANQLCAILSSFTAFYGSDATVHESSGTHLADYVQGIPRILLSIAALHLAFVMSATEAGCDDSVFFVAARARMPTAIAIDRDASVDLWIACQGCMLWTSFHSRSVAQEVDACAPAYPAGSATYLASVLPPLTMPKHDDDHQHMGDLDETMQVPPVAPLALSPRCWQDTLSESTTRGYLQQGFDDSPEVKGSDYAPRPTSFANKFMNKVKTVLHVPSHTSDAHALCATGLGAGAADDADSNLVPSSDQLSRFVCARW